MTDWQNDEYDPEGFFGRDDLVEHIIKTLADPQAEQQRSRAMLVQGPASRGKTWLLCRVHEWLSDSARYRPLLAEKGVDRLAVCFFKGDDFQSHERAYPDEQVQELIHHLLAMLWEALHAHCPGLPWPRNIQTDKPSERRAGILDMLKGSHHQTLQNLITAQIDQVELPVLIIILDGMEEIDPGLLKNFEFEFLHELFRNPRLRLLASRRVDSPAYVWRKPLIKLQNKVFPLTPFQSSDEQIAHLIGPEKPQSDVEAIKDQMKMYTWGNPGANAFLVDCARKNGDQIAEECIQTCLEHLMRSAGQSEPIDPRYFDYVRQMATQFYGIHSQGIGRDKLNQVLGGASDHDRDTILGHLQSRGIGYFGKSGNYVLHPEFVELFQELLLRQGGALPQPPVAE